MKKREKSMKHEKVYCYCLCEKGELYFAGKRLLTKAKEAKALREEKEE